MSRSADLLRGHAEVMKLARLLGREPGPSRWRPSSRRRSWPTWPSSWTRSAPRISSARSPRRSSALLQVAFVLEDPSELSRLFAKLPRGRSAGVIVAAADEGLWLEALDLLNHLHKRQRKEMVLAALALDQPGQEAILDTIIAHDLADEVRLIAEYDDSIEYRVAKRQRQQA